MSLDKLINIRLTVIHASKLLTSGCYCSLLLCSILRYHVTYVDLSDFHHMVFLSVV